MANSSLQTPDTAKAAKPPLSFLPLFLGARPGMTFAESSRLAAHNAGAWLMVLFGVLFVAMNALQGSIDFVALNLAFVSVGLTSLWLMAAGFHRTALTVLSAGSSAVFFVGALTFRNGMENYLLVTLAASILLLDTPITRTLLVGVNAAAFFYAKLQMADAEMDAGFSATRYGTNILLFLLALGGIIEFFRVLNSDYLRSLEDNNSQLDESNRSKERLFSIVAHDLRGPIGNLKASLELLHSGGLNQEEFRGMVNDLAPDIEKAYLCIENLLSWSATQLGGMKVSIGRVDLRENVADALKVFSFAGRQKGVALASEVPDNATVMADAPKLQVVLRNLVTNALKFTPTGGTVTVSAEQNGDAWTLTVRDNGVGMEPERASSLYCGSGRSESTPGTDSEKGLGLGAEICRDFVALLGGTISAESAVGLGTTVRVTLPAA